MADGAARNPFADRSTMNGLNVGYPCAVDEMDIFKVVAHRTFGMSPAGRVLALRESQSQRGGEKIAEIFSLFNGAPTARDA